MKRLHTVLLALAAALMLSAPPAAEGQDATFSNREEALKALTARDPTRRAEAIAWIAEHGVPSDDAALRRRLRDDNPTVRRYAEQALWALWGRSGDDAVDTLMALGVEQMQAQQFRAAIATFSEVIRLKPSFAEGWNKRATVLFMAGDFKRSLGDCDEVVKRNPNHFGALAGYGQIYFQLEQYGKAIEYWKRALRVNPNMEGVEAGIRTAEELLAERRKALGATI
jgi:Flp pilus assembly protein TadD